MLDLKKNVFFSLAKSSTKHHHLIVCQIFIIRLTCANVWESMGKPCSCVQLIKTVFSWLAFLRIVCRITICKNTKACFSWYMAVFACRITICGSMLSQTL